MPDAGIQKIDQLDRISMSALQTYIETFLVPGKKDGSVEPAYALQLSWLITVDFDASAEDGYIAGRRIRFENQDYLVISNATTGQSPITHRTKFTLVGGGANQQNTATATQGSGVSTATLSKNSGIITIPFDGEGSNFIPGQTGWTLNITNTLIGSGLMKNVDVRIISYNGDGCPIVAFPDPLLTVNNIKVRLANISEDAVNQSILIAFNILD